jgi:hypothetical protein
VNQQQVLADFRRRYEGTFVFVEFPDSQKEALFKVDRIEESDSTVGIVCLSSNEYGKIRLNFATDHTIKFKYPPVGVFQNGNQAFFFRRLPAKQYSRGICQGNSDVFAVTNGLYRYPTTLNFTTVDNAFKAQTFGVKEALAMLKGGKHISVALRDGFALSLSLSTQKGLIMYYFDLPVAWLTEDGDISTIMEETYSDQIKQVLAYE